MRFILCLGFILFTSHSYGLNCVDVAAIEVLKDAAKILNVSEKELKVRHIGGESLDGDLHGNVYQNHSGEYFDVFLSSDDVSKDNALQMYAVGIYIYTNAKTDKLIKCDTYLMEAVASDKWQEIYETYF